MEELTAAGCHAAMFQADVADSAAVAEMVRKLGETFSPVELVVNNAGVSGPGLFQDKMCIRDRSMVRAENTKGSIPPISRPMVTRESRMLMPASPMPTACA